MNKIPKTTGAAAAAPLTCRARPVVVLVMLVALFMPRPAWAGANQTAWADDEDMTALYEALVTIQEQHLSPPSGAVLVDKALKGLLRGLDPYSDYLNPAEYRAFKQATRSDYAGVGMDIDQDRHGRITCLPWPGEAAYGAGVRPGDELLAVDDRQVAGNSIFVVGGWIRGQEGRPVVLHLKSASGRSKKLTVIRRPVRAETVGLEAEGELAVIRISRFSPSTAAELARALKKTSPFKGLLFDLRGNSGGDFDAAVAAADLILEPGLTIVSRRGRTGNRRLTAQKQALISGPPIFIWQDGATASAAEVFSAALTENGRARSLGRTSFGKALSQKIIPLSYGAALVLTQAKLFGPSGRSWQGRGLEPEIPVGPGQGRRELLQATRKQLP